MTQWFLQLWDSFLAFLGLARASKRKAVPQRPVQQPPAVRPQQPKPTVTSPVATIKEVYAGDAFDIKPSTQRNAREHMYREKKPGSGERIGPTDNQLKLIFSTRAALPVLAGAGSGKSTSLVNRFLLATNYLNVHLRHITVFTFTRKSRRDFIEKLVEESQFWPTPITLKEAEASVRTFHSKALQLFRAKRGRDVAVFEFLKDDVPAVTKSAEAVTATSDVTPSSDDLLGEEENSANNVDSLMPGDLSRPQLRLLHDAYTVRFSQSSTFRDVVKELLKSSFLSPPIDKDDKDAIEAVRFEKNILRRDEQFSAYVEADWRQRGLWPLPGVRELKLPAERCALTVDNGQYVAHGYIPSVDTYVVLGVHSEIRDTMNGFGRTTPVKNFLASKNKQALLLAQCEQKIRYVTDEEDLTALKKQLHWAALPETNTAPKFKIRIPGERKLVPVFYALFTFGQFAENLSIDPRSLDQLPLLGTDSVEEQFGRACAEYYSSFYEALEARRVWTFNQIFRALADERDVLGEMDAADLSPVQHLLIDEFQDISPAIVKFVTAAQTSLWTKSGHAIQPTLIAVGDDWQSIYGWRGSSPKFFMDFHKYFRGAPKQALQLNQNFRSSANIIRAAEDALIDLRERMEGKLRGVAESQYKDLPTPVCQVTEFKSDDVVRVVRTLLRKKQNGERVFVLSRAKLDATAKAVRNAFRGVDESDLLVTTLHQSKGLEADYVVLLGEIRYVGRNVLRNSVYLKAELASSAHGRERAYDLAQQDEALRLAYVGITRAKQFCIWFAEPKSEGVFERLPRRSDYSTRASVADVASLAEQVASKESVPAQ
ncbi:UvrD-helicase domain-containing protein [Burkholderia cepacia]|uniref:UvrD-helicase domain-containing protein n=1 Tax=Burkholderia cepacia TaxID=292 RepID=UPI001623F929|nr:UvrD-helicase domain-containing protein [Burkholderia cepacia]